MTSEQWSNRCTVMTRINICEIIKSINFSPEKLTILRLPFSRYSLFSFLSLAYFLILAPFLSLSVDSLFPFKLSRAHSLPFSPMIFYSVRCAFARLRLRLSLKCGPDVIRWCGWLNCHDQANAYVENYVNIRSFPSRSRHSTLAIHHDFRCSPVFFARRGRDSPPILLKKKFDFEKRIREIYSCLAANFN